MAGAVPARGPPLTRVRARAAGDGTSGAEEQQIAWLLADLIPGGLSASPSSLEVVAGAVRIGDQFALTTAPGEIFANFSDTLEGEVGGARHQ